MIPKAIQDMLTQSSFGYVCTTDLENAPHVTPIFFVYVHEKGEIYFITDEGSKKVRNLRENRMISLTVDIRDPVNPFNNEGVLVQGKAEISRLELAEEERHPELKQIRKTFRWKYASLIRLQKEPKGEVLVRIQIEKMIHWKGPKFESVRLGGGAPGRTSSP
ncbi:MAG: pyridoxamine 5'-phosphate oxidase family protein [Candidatus Hydrothermarchaeota archaeon]